MPQVEKVSVSCCFQWALSEAIHIITYASMFVHLWHIYHMELERPSSITSHHWRALKYALSYNSCSCRKFQPVTICVDQVDSD